MAFHGNSRQNHKPHHLYEIFDKQADDVFKYGISGDPIEKDGLSERIRIQLDLWNIIAGFVRFVAKVVLANIPGRKRALEIEDDYIAAYADKYGRNPPGNRKKLRRRR